MKDIEIDSFVLLAIYAGGLLCIPLAQIWAVNTLFGLAIPVTFKTYLAAIVLNLAISSRKSTGDKK